METTTKTLNLEHGQSSSSRAYVVHPYEDSMVRSFRSLGFKYEHGATDDTNPSRMINQTAQKSSVQTQLLAANSVSDNVGIWGSRFFTYEGDESGVGTSSASNAHIFDRNSFSHELPIISNHRRFWETQNDHAHSCNQYGIITNNDRPAEIDPVIDLMRIHDILNGEKCLQKELLISELIGFVVKLMIDKKMHSIFQTLLDVCDSKQMDSLVLTILRESESFLCAAFCKQGTKSINKLIKKLKKSNHAFTMTTIFSKKFLELMTHHDGREVIQKCFILFQHEPNEILYEKTINHCHYLAMDKVGCISLNDCISTISGQQRSRLLDSIADISDILCDDPYGNYVLQNVMALNRSDVNARIFDCLRGKFIQLAQRKVGSHTVEKYMGISQTCLLSVVEEMLKSPRIPQVLAQHNFGNYVVQKALRMTREQGFVDQYNSLVNSLKPKFPTLMKTAGGRKVIDVITSDGI